MASNNERRTPDPPAPQSIPLQDLSRPPDITVSGEDSDSDRASFPPPPAGMSSGTRALLGSRQMFSGRIKTQNRYDRVLTGGPSETSSPSALRSPHITTPRTAHRAPENYDDAELSPVNVGDFQAAMGSVGWDLSGPGMEGPELDPGPYGRPLLSAINEDSTATTPYSPGQGYDDGDEYMEAGSAMPAMGGVSGEEGDDRAHLTDARHMQPISGSPLPAASSSRAARGLQRARSAPRGMLGDDLAQLDPGHGGSRRSSNRLSSMSAHSLSRSLSATAASPFSTAGALLRKMSTRVVNLSNQDDVVENIAPRQRQATLDHPPEFPAMTEYAHDEPSRGPSPFEKSPSSGVSEDPKGSPSRPWRESSNPLRGRTLGIFGPTSPLRLRLCDILINPITEPAILLLIVLQTILLAVDAAWWMPYGGRPTGWGRTWLDYAMLALFVVYTVEVAAHIIVSGFIRNAYEYSTLVHYDSVRQAIVEQVRQVLGQSRGVEPKRISAAHGAGADLSIIRTFTSFQTPPDERGHGRQAKRVRLARRAFLRHSFNRLDFVAVVSFWIAFVLSLTNLSSNRHIFVFEMLSCLRILRLLGLTQGTSVILRSLKKAAPLLARVAFLISFFWLLFAIVGVQAFKASLRRTCTWFGPDVEDVLKGNANETILSNAYTQNIAPENVQFCGGHLDYLTGAEMPWVRADNMTPGTTTHKGYLCPQGSLCVEGANPYNGTVSFDNVFQSLELVFVIMSANTFSDILYYTTESDYLAAALFFAAAMVIMTFWLINLLVAVITSSFQVIREESRASAFTADDEPMIIEEEEEQPRKRTNLRRIYDQTYWFWIALIFVSLVLPCLRTADSSLEKIIVLADVELGVTILLLLEMPLRFATDWRNFHRSPRNWVDLFLAVITTVSQVPPIRFSGQPYAWMTFFQIVRVYRIVLALSITRDLILTVLGNTTGVLNLILFVFLAAFIASIFAVQLFRGQIPAQDAAQSTIRVQFADIFNAFVGMYQVLSTENWTALLYTATNYDSLWNTAWMDAMFFLLWYIFANFITLNMFIAVLQENFDVTEDEKRLHQVKAFLQQKDLSSTAQGNLSLSSIFGFGRQAQRHRDPIEYGPATIEMFKDTVVRDFLDEQMEAWDETETEATSILLGVRGRLGFMGRWWNRLKSVFKGREPNPFYSRLHLSKPYEDLDPRHMAQEIATATEQRRKAQRQYLLKHPRYNNSLWIFKPSNTVRRWCQLTVGPGRGPKRVEGVEPNRALWFGFSFVVYIFIVAMVVLACISSPLYQRNYFASHGGYTNRNWFVWTDLVFAGVFTLEALVKVIADGFFFTPNAYFRSTWGFIDAVVLITLWLSVSTSLYNLGQVSRGVGAFKALRALRLLNVSDSARDTFHSVIVVGGWKVISAAFVSLSLLIPFAILGLNLFSGQMLICNDNTSGINFLSDCVGEWQSSPFGWNVIAPRQVANPYYNFDNFGDSLSILFQIVSQEGWIDVMWSATSARGVGLNPIPFSSQGNAVFFIIFNLLGAVFVLTLFVSVFMRNHTEQTGVAFLTADQRSWLELRNLLRQISPSKRPSNRPNERWKIWCYRIAIKKHGRWQRFINSILILHLILLAIEFYPEINWWERLRDAIFLVFTLFYAANMAIRVIGLTWSRFRKNSWDVYSLIAVTGTVITTVLDLAQNGRNPVIAQLHKLFLVSIALLIIPRNNELDQLFKTAASSLTSIINLMAVWFILFLVFAIAMNQTLGLVRFASLENSNINLRTVPKALILLFRMSLGEGWNQIMEDYATVEYPFCNDSRDFFDNDCGSAAWARTLFIAWNITSMYIFVSLFVSLIYESFSYVYQRSSGLSAVSRDEIRRFKQAWATFDPNGTGYIPKEAFPRLLGELSGVFEMRIYDGEHTVNSILEHCRIEPRGTMPQAGVVAGVDLALLNERLDTLDVTEVRRRRARLNLFSHEVLVSADPDRGVSFLSCLMILAHYNVISDSKSLRLEEFLRRRYRLQRVDEEVRRRIVIGFFDTLFWSRQFRRRKELRKSARMVNIPQFAVPEIFVDDQDGPTPLRDVFDDSDISRDESVPSDGSPRPSEELRSGLGSGPASPQAGHRGRGLSFDSSPTRSERHLQAQQSPSFRPRRPSDTSDTSGISPFDGQAEPSGDHLNVPLSPARSLSPGTGTSTSLEPSASVAGRSGTRHRRQQSSVASSHLTPLEAFDNSAWGESIRKSFTVRRKNTRGRTRPGRMDV